MDAMTRSEVLRLSGEGWSQRAIAEELDVSRGSVWRALQDAGWEEAGGASASETVEGLGWLGDLVMAVLVVGSLLLGLWREFRIRRVLPSPGHQSACP